MDAKAFYQEFTLRNNGFISKELQDLIARSHVLVAGCGSTGGGAIELLVRTGFTQLTLTDNGEYELNNINRQRMNIDDIEVNKARAHAAKVLKINPYLDLSVDTRGICADNVDHMIAQADIIVDGVDVTTRSGLEAKFLLHETAKKYYKPVISGYDMDATQYVAFHDYRLSNEPVLRGHISRADIRDLEPLQTCIKLIKPKHLPLGILEELERINEQGKSFVSQLGIAANLFGVIAVAMAVKILDGKYVKPDIYIDMWEQVSIYSESERLQKQDYIRKLTYNTEVA